MASAPVVGTVAHIRVAGQNGPVIILLTKTGADRPNRRILGVPAARLSHLLRLWPRFPPHLPFLGDASSFGARLGSNPGKIALMKAF